MSERLETGECKTCDYDASMARSPMLLPHGTLLHNKFQVGRVLGKPGYTGITYLAWDTVLESRVAIKEFFPSNAVSRDPTNSSVVPHTAAESEPLELGLKTFLDEARMLARFSHANIVRVREFFEQHGTGYFVMDYLDGVTLGQLIDPERPYGIDAALSLMDPVLDGLEAVHAQGFLHRDIKPSNIYVTKQGVPLLLDFGAARMAYGDQTASMSVVLTPGFAPLEQYSRRGEHGPWSDVYGAAATLYSMLTGRIPAESLERVSGDTLAPPSTYNPHVPAALDAVIVRALSISTKARQTSATEFRNDLRAVGGSTPLSSSAPVRRSISAGSGGETTRARKAAENPEDRLPWWLWLALLTGLGLLASGLLLYLAPASTEPPLPAPASESPPTPAPVAATVPASRAAQPIPAATPAVNSAREVSPEPPVQAGAERAEGDASPADASRPPGATQPDTGQRDGSSANDSARRSEPPGAGAPATRRSDAEPERARATRPREFGRPRPPPFAFDACRGLQERASCTARPPGRPALPGTCESFAGQLGCIPNGRPPGPGRGPRAGPPPGRQ